MIDNKGKYLTVGEFAKLVHYSERRIRQMIKAEKIDANRIPSSRKLLIPVSELERVKKEVEKAFRADLVPAKTAQREDTKLTKPYDRERFLQSDKIMNEMELAHLLTTLQDEHYYTLSDFRKVLRWVSFFNLKSNDYYDKEIQQLCSQLSHSLTELIIFMKLEFAKSRHEQVYRLIYNDTIGKTEETLTFKSQKLKGSIDDVRLNERVYRTLVSEKLMA